MYNEKDLLVPLTLNISILHRGQSKKKKKNLDLCFGNQAQELKNQRWPQEGIDVDLDVAEQVASEVPTEHHPN